MDPPCSPGQCDGWRAERVAAVSEAAGVEVAILLGESPMTLRPELKVLGPQTLFAWGDKDIYGPAVWEQEMAAVVPRARCIVVPGAGHWPWIDQPEFCARLSLDFLKDAASEV
jgi:pimeloyl-ACP methyl ester carboxylesterase